MTSGACGFVGSTFAGGKQRIKKKDDVEVSRRKFREDLPEMLYW